MGKQQCVYCFFGRVHNSKYEEELDKLLDVYPSGYDAFRELQRRHSDASERCRVCNGTGYVEASE